MQPTNQPQQPSPIQGAMNQQQQPDQPAPSIDPQLLQSIIDNLKSQSQQIEQQQDQLAQSNDIQAQQASQMLKQKQQTIAKAMSQLSPTSQLGQIGQVFDGHETPSANNGWSGECEAYVEDQTYGKTGMFPSAVSAWNNYAQNGQTHQGLDGIKKGDILYWAPDSSNQNFGHASIYEGDGEMKSATYSGVKVNQISSWPQTLLGYVTPSSK